MADGSVIIDSKLDTSKINGQINSLKSNLSKGFSAMAKAGGIALGAATAAVTAFSVSAVKDFVTFQDKMNEVFTLIPGASEEMKESMIEDVKSLSKEMGVLPEDVIPAVYQALSAGVPKENVFDFVKDATKLAKAGVASLDDSVGVLSTVVNNYAKTGLTAAQASDMLFTAVKDGVTSMPELASKLGDVVPIASSLGIGFDEVAGATAAMTAIMGKGSTTKAVTNLRGMLNELGKEGSAADIAFQKVAGEGFTQFIEKGGTMQEAMGILATAAEEENTSINNLFGSIEAGQAALILAGDGADKFAGILDDMGNSTGATDEAFKTMTDSTQFSIDKIKANIETLKLDLAQKFIPAFDNLLDSVIGMFEGSEGATDDFVKTLVDTIMEVLDGIIPMITDLAPKLIDGASDILEALVKGISENTDMLADSIGDIFTSLLDFVVANLPTLTVAAIRIMVSLASSIVRNIPTIITAIGTMTGDMVDELIDYIPEFLQAGKDIIGGLLKGIKDLAKKPIDTIMEVGSNMLDGFKNFFGIKSPSKAMAEIGKDVIGGLLKGIKDMASKPVDAIVDVGKKMWNGIKGFFESESPSKLMAKLGKWIDEGLAKGIRENEDTVANAWRSLGSKLIAEANDTAGTVGKIINTLKGSFGDAFTEMGKAIVDGAGSWDIFAKAGLKALADVLQAIGVQLVALGVVNILNPAAGFGVPYFAGGAAAFTASGIVSANAAKYEVGGIIKGDQLANIHDGEGIIPRGLMQDAKTAGLSITPNNQPSSQNITGNVYIDGRKLARILYQYSDENVGLSYVG